MKKWLISIVAFALIIGMTGAFYFSKTEISAQSFKTSDEIQTVQSKEQLKAYFEKVKELQKQQNNGVMATEESANTMEAKDTSGSKSGGYSTTNNQVEGVDEADAVKTNGTHVFSLSENNVIIANIKDPKQMKEETTISFKNDFYPTQLLLSNQTLMVIGQKNVLRTLDAESTQKMNSVMMPMDSMTTVYFYDIANPAKPKLMREIATEGYMNGARLTNNTLYYVTTIYPKFWIMEENADAELRPFTYDSKSDKEAKPMSYDSIAILPSSLEGNYSIISAINVSKPAENEVKTKGYLGGSEQLYMSKDNLYLTSTIYEQNNINAKKMIWNPGEMDTEVFKFALDKTSVKFVASNRLTGTILNQFSMDEHNGYFRAVTTKGNSWDENKVSENNLFILDDKMKTVGSLTGLAKDERIYSARFMGDKAYMVTFKETDPLFVIDVAKPTDPKVLGELKIPGFSNYLHPLDENHLIGFGYETIVDTQSGGKQPVMMTGGMKISLFDVSDFAKPKELDTEIIGDQGTYSPVQYDHHALFEHKEKGLYGFPISIYGKGKEYAEFKQDGALIYEITPENGIVLKGDLLNSEDPKQQYENWETSIQRIIYVEDSLYTIAMKEIKSYNLNSFKQLSKMSY